MVQPNLIHPVPIKIQQLDVAETYYDDDYREPVQQAAHKNYAIVPGQIKWGSDDRLSATRGGAEEGADGYVLFRYVDLAKAGITLKLNDRMIQLGKLDTDVYIIRLQPMGHYSDMGGATLVKAYFADRQPARQRLGDMS